MLQLLMKNYLNLCNKEVKHFENTPFSPIIPLSLLSKVEVGLCNGGPGLLTEISPEVGQGTGLCAGLESVP